MKNKLVNFMLLIMATCVFFSCEKYNENDEQNNSNQEANSTLIVRTRVANTTTENGTISYPVNIYVFDSSNKCVETTSIETADEQISLKLPEGSYDVYAIAGADTESYDLPAKENATKVTVISLKSGKNHSDIMTAHNTVTLAYGEKNTLTLSLSRKVMLIETVTMNNIPSNVTAVSVEISPLYKNILLNGEYSAEASGAQKISLSEENDGTTWKTVYDTYLLEASGPATVKVSLTTDAGSTKSYSYSSTEEFKANHKINITGTYNENGFNLSGNITGATWGDPIDITFGFDETGSTTEENTDNNGGEISGNAPEVGTLYEDCYVLKSEKTESGTVVTLMSTTYEDKFDFGNRDQETIKSAIDAGIARLAVEKITGWRLPTYNELQYIKSNITDIQNNLTRNGKVNFPPNYFYYFLTQDNKISSYNLTTDISNDDLTGGSSFILRAFATITFTE